MNWAILKGKAGSPKKNMEADKNLLERLEGPVLHLYEWEGDAATFGYFVKPEEWLDLEAAQKEGLRLARRPTGGGIIFHTCDLAFSVLLPASHQGFSINTLENYRWVNERVVQAICQFDSSLEPELLPTDPSPQVPGAEKFCMAKPTIYDIVIGGKKVGGAAQRRTRKGFLHQGTISLVHPEQAWLKKIVRPGVHELMRAQTYPLLEDRDQLEKGRKTLRNLLIEAFCSC